MSFGKKFVVGYYSGKLLLQNFYGKQPDLKMFAEEELLLIVHVFSTYFGHILEGLKDYDGSMHNAWNVSAPFYSL